MNKKNLKKIANLMLTIPLNTFSMAYYRQGSKKYSIECNTVGCALGHSTILDPEPEKIPRFRADDPTLPGSINFDLWGQQFTGLRAYESEWCWCFSSCWAHHDNSPAGVYKRIHYLLKYGIPSSYFKNGNEALFVEEYNELIKLPSKNGKLLNKNGK